MRILLFLATIFIGQAQAVCLFSCNTDKCSSLGYYLKNCNKCSKIGSKCAAAFCRNHPTLCDDNRPLRPLSIDTQDIVDEKVYDVCLAKLFPPFTFKGNSNSDININNLNMLNITFFSQTGGSALERNVGTVQNVLVNYLLYITPQLYQSYPYNIESQLNSWILKTFGLNLQKSNNFQFHMIIEYMRRELYRQKGIPTKIVNEYYNNHFYPVTISDLGCSSEKMFQSPPHRGNR